MLTPAEEAALTAKAGILPLGVAGSATPAFAQTFDRRFCTSTVLTPTSGTMYMTAINLSAGQVVKGITFVSVGGETGGTNLWFALYRSDLVLMGQATNDTGATSFASGTAFRMALATAQTCPYTGMYYLAFMCTHSAGTTPTLHNVVATAATVNGSIAGMPPILSATSSTGLTSTAPNPAGALTAIVNSLYAFVD